MIKTKLWELSPEHIVLLENSYLKHFSTHIPDKLILDYKSIIEYKDLIKNSKPDRRILNHLLDIAIEKIKNKQRFQKITFIKLIRRQTDPHYIDEKISEKLFFVFQSLITEVNDTIAWSLSVTIKDIELSQENIEWLIDHFKNSEHIQNRLLRYPKPNKAITTWGNQRLKYGELSNRLSELIGLRLNFDTNFNYKDKRILLWGIHYSKLSDSIKKELLLKHLTKDNFDDLINICEKNSFTDIISQLYNDFTSEH